MIRTLLPENVYDRALLRIRWLWNEFGRLGVGTSGGKDSTVIYELARIVARERGEQIPVYWLDQECEHEATVEQVRYQMHEPEVECLWHQIPFRLFNATSHRADQWLHVWDEDHPERWLRPKEPDSIHRNVYGTDRFAQLLTAMGDRNFAGACTINGVRVEESPARRQGLTSYATYKWITWGNAAGKAHWAFSPIYDWTWRDVWKAIHANGWRYNTYYDGQWRYGVPVRNMRVSNYHHETAVRDLYTLQELEPETYERATQRIQGIDTTTHLGAKDFGCPKQLPHMFTSWEEYRDYLLTHLVDDEFRPYFERKFANDPVRLPRVFADPGMRRKWVRTQITSVLTNDWEFVKLEQAWLALERRWRDRGPSTDELTALETVT